MASTPTTWLTSVPENVLFLTFYILSGYSFFNIIDTIFS